MLSPALSAEIQDVYNKQRQTDISACKAELKQFVVVNINNVTLPLIWWGSIKVIQWFHSINRVVQDDSICKGSKQLHLL